MKTLVALLLATAALGQEPQPAPAAGAAMPASEEFIKAVYFGKKFAEIKDYATAYQQFAKADALQPDQPQVLYNMAVLLAKAGRFSESQAKVDRYNQLFPAGAEKPMITKLQLELEFQRELQKRRQTEQEYTDLFNRGRFLYSKNDLAGALKQFQDAEQKRPTDPAAVYDQAVIYEKLGDFAKASERYHRHEELESDAEAKGATDRRLLALESEIEDMKTKIVCPFCGLRLPIGATWCHRCWHGPYLTSSPIWNSRPCGDGATATRATYYADGRFAKNDTLPCLFSGPVLDTLRYTAARQHAIQDARKAEGWTYNGEIIQGYRDQVKYVQGSDYLEKIIAPITGEILGFGAHGAGDGKSFLLDREDVIIDGQKYTNSYTFDAQNRIVQQQVEYQNAAGCNHVITMTADVTYANDLLSSVKITGGYEGTVVEGSPRTDWTATIAYAYDTASRVTKEDLTVTAFSKTYKAKPYGAERDDVNKLYDRMRVNRPIENILSAGDRCGTAGSTILGNPIDLRPFYAITPNLATVLGGGITRATVTFTY
jgi:Flp pilus assembly protein TadD/ribosomal protein L40E